MALFDTETFGKALVSQLEQAKPNVDKNELLEDFFKLSVAQLLAAYIEQYDVQAIDAKFHEMMLSELVTCFRQAPLGEYQRSVDWYEKMFNQTMQEIVANATSGKGMTQTSTNSTGYGMSGGGIWVPPNAR